MITAPQVQTILLQAFPGAQINVQSADNVHFDATIQAPQFAGLSRVTQQQRVYAALGNLISDGTIHALSLHTSVL